MNILLVGCNGKMGTTIARICSERNDISISCGLDVTKKDNMPFPVYTNEKQIPVSINIDAVIDFSHPSGVIQTANFCYRRKCH